MSNKKEEYKDEWNTWRGMKERCSNQNHKSYKTYGELGITVCDKWQSFSGFFEDMGMRPEGHSLDRINNLEGYSKDNCKWVSATSQANNKSNNRMLTYNGKSDTLANWVKNLNLNYTRVKSRLAYGWSVEKAFNEACRYDKNSCNQGHPFVDGSYTTNGAGKRRCKICQKDYDKKRNRNRNK